MNTIKLRTTLNRFCTFYSKDSAEVPQELFSAESIKPDLSAVNVPLPSRKKDYTCFAVSGDGAMWLGSDCGVTRWMPEEDDEEDVVMHFSANRYLYDNKVISLIADNDKGVWVQTETGVTHIEMKMISPRDKAEKLLEESLKYVDRRGMMTQKHLTKARDLDSIVPYGHSDNDGCFTAAFAIAKMFRYEVLKRELGENDPKVNEAFAIAVRSCEACLLLMHISKRGNGFVARSYMVADEPVPDDGIFYRINGDKAVGLDTAWGRERGVVGKVIDASTPIPERLRKLYTSLGYTDEGLVYKGDTSSDEITLHFLQMYFAHKFLAPTDSELGELIKASAVGLMNHIIDHGYELFECDNKSTTWAKWSLSYFNTMFGWADACLNSAEALSYLKITMAITGEKGRWEEEYNKLIDLGYADLTLKHYDRAFQASLAEDGDLPSELMYGDNMLAITSLWALINLEEDEKLNSIYKQALSTWEHALVREDMPGYEYLYALCLGEDTIDTKANAKWFERFNISRLAAGVSVTERYDIAKRYSWATRYAETSFLTQPDEHFIAKYDRNPWEYKNEDSRGVMCVESCYVYTFAYWLGLYYGFIED